jgi:hypothetical protein
MIKMRRLYVLPMYPLISITLLAAVPSHVFARDPLVEIPEHASAKRYGGGWECDRGYREANGICMAVKVPADAYATNASYGPGWECNWGYGKVDETCVAIEVPPNAYLNASGSARWTCDRGYRPVGEACVPIEVPVNGYLTDDSYRTGWKCERGYREAREACVALDIPENAHIDYSGNDWECNEPYQKRQGKCARL